MSADDSGKPNKEARIQELMEVKARGVGAGVCGREWCEVCGKEGSFSGFLGAMWAHTASGRFVCGGCLKGPMRTESNGGNPLTLDQLILERGFRYCGGCGQEVILPEPMAEEARRLPFTCPACEGLDRGRAARRRYLEHKATEKGGLERATARIHWAKAGIERILAETDTDPDADD